MLARITSGPFPVKMRNGGVSGQVWTVQLGETHFKITIQDDAAAPTIEKAISDVQRLPIPYHKAFAIVSEPTKDGVAYYNDLGANSAAHGSQNYLNLIYSAAWAIPHEVGHVLEQRVTRGDPTTLTQWAQAIKDDNISVSRYGDNNSHEDLAEFAEIYAYCLDSSAADLARLQSYSPNRFAQWQNILSKASADIASSSAQSSMSSSVRSSLSSSLSSLSSISSSRASSSRISSSRSSSSSLLSSSISSQTAISSSSSLSLSSSSSSWSSDRNRYDAPKTTAPTIDGVPESLWDKAAWAPIDIFWLGSQRPSAQDFSGRYKAMWDEDNLYLLVDITDDILLDATVNPLERYWDDDSVEIFVDENKNGGNHQFNTSAWAYHISTLGENVDFTNSTSPRLLNDHVSVRLVSQGTKRLWEISMRIYGENYADGANNTPLKLSSGKLMGFSVAYNDNDQSSTRESMMGSVDTQGHKNDRGYIDASVFGSLRLIEAP